MGNCCKFIKRSRYRNDEKSVDPVGYKQTSNYNIETSTGPQPQLPNEKRRVSSDFPNNQYFQQVNNAVIGTNNVSIGGVATVKSFNGSFLKQNNNSMIVQPSMVNVFENKLDDVNASIPHIADFYPEDNSTVPADNPLARPMFLPKASFEKHRKKTNETNSFTVTISETNLHVSKKYNSCSTIYIDDSTVSQPNLKSAIRLVACAIHYHIKRRTGDRTIEIFDERKYPLSRDTNLPANYENIVPDHRLIYKFMKNLFTAAQLTAECAIVTLIYLERVLTYAEIDLCPLNWKRLILGAILLASKVWDDQAVWNVDYCQILKDINVDNMNELERQYLNMLQFNINVPSSVYAKYYFDLRTLAEDNHLSFPQEPLTKEKALRLEAYSSEKYKDMIKLQIKNMRRTCSADNLYSPSRKSLVILS
jgi:hypothetical protein